MYKKLRALISKNKPYDGRDIYEPLNESIQSVFIKGLSYYYKAKGITFVGETSLRFAHQINRYLHSNRIAFKLNDGDIDFTHDMKEMKDRFAELLEVDIDLIIKRDEKKRRLDNGFYIEKSVATFSIYSTDYEVTYYRTGIGETINCSPYDEHGISIHKEEVAFEDLDSTYAFILREAIGDDKFEVSHIYDLGWMIQQGAHADPEYFEQLINDTHMSMLEIRFNNFIHTMNANSTLREMKNFDAGEFSNLSNQATFALQINEVTKQIINEANHLSISFDETFENKREAKLGLLKTEGSDAQVDGANVKGSGLKAARMINGRDI